MMPDPQAEGRVIGGRYELDERIGEGGMGTVWRATDRTLRRNVAVKLLFSGDERDRDVRVDRFLREARIAAAVQHRNVVHIVDFGSTEEGRPYMVMEYLRGETLAERLVREPAPSLETAIGWIAEALRGLGAAHDAGVVHRDVKPENVFLVEDRDGAYPKILDFGISRSLAPESGPSSALTTKEGFLIGTPQYMSPEQARGLRDIDARTDLYSVGVILYEMLTGRLPFDSENVGDLIIQIAGGGAFSAVDLRPEIGEPLSVMVDRAIAVAREDRYQDARAMRDALTEALGQTDAAGREQPARSRLGKTGSLSGVTAKPTVRSKTPGSTEKGTTAPDAGLAATLPAQRRAAAPVPAPAVPPATTGGGMDALPQRRSAALPITIGVVAVAAAAAWVMTQREPAPAQETTPGPPPAAMPELTPASEPDEPAIVAPAPETVTVRLEGVPPAATVRVDGEPTTDDPIVLPRDDQEHALEVLAEGMQPWSATHAASADGVYRVELAPIPAPVKSAQRARPARASEMQARTPPATLRDLDY